MAKEPSAYELPKSIDRHLAALSKLYEIDGNRELQELIVNAQTSISEEWSFDNWNGGTAGHALYLILPEQLFLRAVKKKDDIQAQIEEDLNKLHNVQNEFIEKVFIELEVGENHDWRSDSGLLLVGKRSISPEAVNRIWLDETFRLFLSHKSEVKIETAQLKDELRLFGISCFVAHEDIHPTRTWQDEIENALQTMDGFVALMTTDFHDSDWTDQEVGYAFARRVPMIAVRLGKNPYGFIGKFQGLASTWATAAADIAGILIKNDRMFSVYVKELRKCRSWDHGNALGKLLSGIPALNPKQVDELVVAYNETQELRGAFAFNGTKERIYGPGLVSHLNRLDTRKFRFTKDWLIEQIP